MENKKGKINYHGIWIDEDMMDRMFKAKQKLVEEFDKQRDLDAVIKYWSNMPEK